MWHDFVLMLQTWMNVPPARVRKAEHVSTWKMALSVSALFSGLGRPVKSVQLRSLFIASVFWTTAFMHVFNILFIGPSTHAILFIFFLCHSLKIDPFCIRMVEYGVLDLNCMHFIQACIFFRQNKTSDLISLHEKLVIAATWSLLLVRQLYMHMLQGGPALDLDLRLDQMAHRRHRRRHRIFHHPSAHNSVQLLSGEVMNVKGSGLWPVNKRGVGTGVGLLVLRFEP